MKFRFMLLLVGFAFFSSFLQATVSDTNFTETTFETVPSGTTGMAWAPDGSNRLFVSLKDGNMRIIKNGALSPTPFATVSPVYLNSECGLIGFCFDPNFAVNRYIYMFVTVTNSQQQIIRYQDNNDIGTNKTILIPGLPTAGNNHDGGSIGFGHDGKLYWGIGDLGNGTGVDGNLNSLAAKIGRANTNGTPVFGNPFADGAGPNNEYIWARGIRNPYTLTFHPFTGDLWLNVVGTSYEQIFVVKRGDHLGYNDYENNQPAGYIKPLIKYRTNGTDTRNLAAGSGAVRSNNVVTLTTAGTHGFRRGEKITISGVTDTSFNGVFYVAEEVSATSFRVAQIGPNATSGGGSAVTLSMGGCVTGGAFYDSTAFPTSYQTNFFFGDYISGRINRAVLDGSTQIATVDYFATSVGSAIDVSVGPDGALYYMRHNGTIYRLRYNNTAQKLIVSPTGINMAEGGEIAFMVSLATAPVENVSVNITKTSGDPDISVMSGASLTFTPANFAVPQPVRLIAALDNDFDADKAVFEVAATSMSSVNVYVNAFDVQGTSTPFTITSVEPGALGKDISMSAQSGRVYVLQGSQDFNSWLSIGTNLGTSSPILFNDAGATNQARRFYRAYTSE